jgi:hypothetical protein
MLQHVFLLLGMLQLHVRSFVELSEREVSLALGVSPNRHVTHQKSSACRLRQAR